MPTAWSGTLRLLVSLLAAWQGLLQAQATAAPLGGEAAAGPDSIIVKLRFVPKAATFDLGSTAEEHSWTPPAQFDTRPVPEGLTAAEFAAQLVASGEAEYAEPNFPVRLLGATSSPLVPNDPLVPQQYHLALTRAEEAWAMRTDAGGIKVCVVDTGVDYSHPDLVDNLSESSYNAADDSADATDENGHGTLVAGTLGATGNNSFQGAGVAWRVELLPCKIFPDGSDMTDIATAQKCLQWCIDQGTQVSVNSWGMFQSDPPPKSLREVLEAANAAGHVAVFAAGNDGVDMDVSDAKSYPAAFTDLPNLISVASTDRDGQLASNDLPWSSNYGGSTITLAAPGVDILGPALSGNVTTATGTSFAAPQVAGAVALLMAEAQARGLQLQPCHYKALLVETVEQLPGLNGTVQANGLLNIERALQAVIAGAIPPCPPLPADSPVPAPTPAPASGAEDRSLPWASAPPSPAPVTRSRRRRPRKAGPA